MSNHQKKVKLKASIAEFVGPLLQRLKQAKEQVLEDSEMEIIIDQISADVVKAKGIFDSIENWDREVTGYFGEIERQIDYWTERNNKTIESNETTRTNLINVHNQLSGILMENYWNTKKASDMPQKAPIFDVGEPSNRSFEEDEVSMVLECLESLGLQAMGCLYSLGIFPENAKLKKRLLIYWWIGLGLVVPFWAGTSRTIEKGEKFFSYLVHKGVLIPEHIIENNQVIYCWTIQPTIHKQLISACRRKHLFSSEKREEGTWHLYKNDAFNMKALLNRNQRYLNSKHISSMQDMRLVILGSWRYTEAEVHNGVEKTECEETKLKDHIEVDETDFLKKMGEKVTYLSLQGISRIEELHESIGKLKNLMILDLKACHNLEKLSQKSRSTIIPKLIKWALPRQRWFKKLMVLDVSECYLLDNMPKWVCDLSNLEVLKGFVVSNVGSKIQSCQLSDLSKLNKLRKLSIRIASDYLLPADFSSLKHLDRLLVLTIIWGGNKSNSAIPTFSFPKNLEKLDIRCYPYTEASNLLNPAELKNLKRLYIRGGKLTNFTNDENWKVETLRLRFLTNLETDWIDLKRLFKNLKYVEYVECPMLQNFPEGRCCLKGDEIRLFIAGMQ
ncbi:disease resistance RPP13-like protein 4 [Carex rostrata]